MQKVSQTPFRTDLLKGRVALITGGATGIGFGIARALGMSLDLVFTSFFGLQQTDHATGQHGAKVAVFGRRQDVLDAAVKTLRSEGIGAHPVQGDVRNYESVQSAVSEVVKIFGKLG
jgi:peroxisomal 2,4-dienoyl-CoA reductase